MKRIILSILSVFITLGAAAETGQALPAVQRAATAVVEETPSGKEGSVPPETSDTPGTGTAAAAETTSGLAAETDTATAAGTAAPGVALQRSGKGRREGAGQAPGPINRKTHWHKKTSAWVYKGRAPSLDATPTGDTHAGGSARATSRHTQTAA